MGGAGLMTAVWAILLSVVLIGVIFGVAVALMLADEARRRRKRRWP